jgi:1-acyl-sn-glycerol-3-phosphate acyltransferase
MRVLRAWVRLMRASLHLLHGMFIVQWHFDAYEAPAREARIQWWSAKLLRLLGLQLHIQGEAALDEVPTLVVANHVSWLDIAALHAVIPQARFVSKADVLQWPLIGRLVAGAGTLFIERERKRDAVRVVHHMAQALSAAQTVAVFPEGTVSDGTGVMPFHANLFQAAVATQARVCPVVLRFSNARGELSPAALYLDDTTLLQSAWRLASESCTHITVWRLPPIALMGMDRRAAAAAAQASISAGLASLASASSTQGHRGA